MLRTCHIIGDVTSSNITFQSDRNLERKKDNNVAQKEHSITLLNTSILVLPLSTHNVLHSS